MYKNGVNEKKLSNIEFEQSVEFMKRIENTTQLKI